MSGQHTLFLPCWSYCNIQHIFSIVEGSKLGGKKNLSYTQQSLRKLCIVTIRTALATHTCYTLKHMSWEWKCFICSVSLLCVPSSEIMEHLSTEAVPLISPLALPSRVHWLVQQQPQLLCIMKASDLLSHLLLFSLPGFLWDRDPTVVPTSLSPSLVSKNFSGQDSFFVF